MLKDFETLEDVVSDIYDCYTNLFCCEDYLEYKKLLEEIKAKRSKEESILRKISKSYRLVQIEDYVNTMYNKALDTIITLEDFKNILVVTRIINDLDNMNNYDEEFISYTLILDLIRLTLRIFATFSSSEDLKNMKKRIWFTFRDLESEGLNNDFEIPHETFIMNEVFMSSQYIKNVVFERYLSVGLKIMANDPDFSSKIFGLSLARASLVLMEQKYSQEVIEFINKELVDASDENPFKYLFSLIIDNYESDRRIPSYVSLKREL